jgi:hypothetical protein
VRLKLLRVAAALDENGTEIVRGTVKTEVFFDWSDAVSTIGKFWTGRANALAINLNETGVTGVKKPCGMDVLRPKLAGISETLTPNCGVVPGAAVVETCTVVVEPGVKNRLAGAAWIMNGAAGVTLTENGAE